MMRLIILLLLAGIVACQRVGDRNTISGDSGRLWKAEKNAPGSDSNLVQQRIERILFNTDSTFVMMSLSGEETGSWHYTADPGQLVLRFPDSGNADTLHVTRLDEFRMSLLAADSSLIHLKARR